MFTSFIHVFLRFVPRCCFTCRVRSEGRQKALRPTAPKMGPRCSANRRNLSKGAGVPVLFCSKHARWTLTATSNAKTLVQPAAVYRTPGATPQTPKLTYFRIARQLRQESSKIGFCEWQRWFLESGARFACAYPHTSRGNSIEFAIHIGAAAELVRMQSKATKHIVALRSGLVAKLLRISSKSYERRFHNSPHWLGRKTTNKCLQIFWEKIKRVSSSFLQLQRKSWIVLSPSHCVFQLTP